MTDSNQTKSLLEDQPSTGIAGGLFQWTFSAWMLVAVNSLPILGGLFLNWDIRSILIIYWAENLVIGFYNILKMALAKSGPNAQKAFLIPFFTVHFGGFCAVHGVFIMVFVSATGSESFGSGLSPLSGPFDWPGPLAFPAMLLNVIAQVVGTYGLSVVIPVLGLIVSHGISFWQNYILKGEYLKSDPAMQMFRPYGRVMITHVAIIFAAVPIFLLGSPMPLLILLVIMKTVLDLILHSASHGPNNLTSRLKKMFTDRLEQQRKQHGEKQ